MDLIDVISTVMEISQSRGSYGEEIELLQQTLSVLQKNLQSLGSEELSIPDDLHESIRNEVQRAQDLLKNIPEKAGMQENYIKFKLQHIDFKTSREHTSTAKRETRKIGESITASSMRSRPQAQPQNNHQHHALQPTIVEPEFMPTMFDPNAELNHLDENPKVILQLQTERHIKDCFVKYGIHTREVLTMVFKDKENTCEIFKFARPYYLKMVGECDQINQISREHAIITATRTPKTPEKQMDFIKPQIKHEDITERKSPQEEVFLTCQEFDPNEVLNLPSPAPHSDYSYTFHIKNLGQMGTFVQKNPPELNEEPLKNSTPKWTRLGNQETAELGEGDRIALLFQKPSYKIPLICYEFRIQT